MIDGPIDTLPKILCLIQARMGSTRLPGKSMALLAGKPLVEHVVTRAHRSQLSNYICVATTDQPADDVLAAHVQTLHNTGLYRGASEDVLGRFASALLLYPDVEVIVRVCADDPFVDGSLIDLLLTAFLTEWAEPREDIDPPHYMQLGGLTWPTGLGLEVFSRKALQDAAQYATDPEDREHVTPWMQRAYPAWVLKDPYARGLINTRWTIDYPADMEAARAVYDRLYDPSGPPFDYDDLIAAGIRSFDA